MRLLGPLPTSSVKAVCSNTSFFSEPCFDTSAALAEISNTVARADSIGFLDLDFLHG
jgi:hypothetical protein